MEASLAAGVAEDLAIVFASDCTSGAKDTFSWRPKSKLHIKSFDLEGWRAFLSAKSLAELRSHCVAWENPHAGNRRILVSRLLDSMTDSSLGGLVGGRAEHPSGYSILCRRFL